MKAKLDKKERLLERSNDAAKTFCNMVLDQVMKAPETWDYVPPTIYVRNEKTTTDHHPLEVMVLKELWE